MKNMIQQTTQDCFHNLIGISYEELDCYGLVKNFYAQVFNYQLDLLYDVRPNILESHKILNQQKNNFQKVTSPKFGDIIVFNVPTLPAHIGIYIDSTMFLHTRKHTGSVLERWPNWKKRVEGFYRVKD